MADKLSLIQFFKQYPTEEKAVKYFEQLRWGEKITCPYCGKNRIATMKGQQPMPYRCKDCRKFFSVRTGTILTESKLFLQKWLLAIHILTNTNKGVSSIQFAKYLDTTQKTAWFLGHRIREAWMRGSNKIHGVVEVDETYIGGKESNKHESKKLNAGCGVVGKTPAVGAKFRDGLVKAFVLKETNTKNLENMVINSVDKSTLSMVDIRN